MTHDVFIPSPPASPSFSPPNNLLRASSIIVSYDSLTTSASSNTATAHFTISGTGPRDPLTIADLVQESQNPFRIVTKGTKNPLGPAGVGTWRIKKGFEVHLPQAQHVAVQHTDDQQTIQHPAADTSITVEVVVYSAVQKKVLVLSFALAPGERKEAGREGGMPL